MITEQLWDLAESDRFLSLHDFVPGVRVLLKLEGLNPAGSIKLKTARQLVHDAELSGRIQPGAHLIESSSGSLGVALASVAAARGYHMTVVTDPNASPRSVAHMRALGAEVVVVSQRDANGGYLQTRIDLIRQWVNADPRILWLNQYENPANPDAHRRHTYREIVESCGDPDWLFIGAGTTGTLMGCLQGSIEHASATRLVAVDTAGSVTFGTPPGPRHIPGLGTSSCPPIFKDSHDLTKVHVEEIHAVRMCRRIAKERGLLVGGSTGTVLAAVAAMSKQFAPRSTVVVISPDLGERYLDTIYNDDWAVERFGAAVLDVEAPPEVIRFSQALTPAHVHRR